MKFLATGDLHWAEHSRLAECRRIHDHILQLVQTHQPDGFLCGGDVFDGASTPFLRSLVADFFQSVAEVCPVVIAKGNHDREYECALLARLRAKHPIMVEEAAGICRIGDALIAVVAWPERHSILKYARAYDWETDLLTEQVLQNILRGLGAELAKNSGPKLALGHFMVSGAQVSTGQPLLGQPMTVSLSDLSLLQAPVVLMSHIHKPQGFFFGDMEALYLGSPYRTSYGETEDKSITLVEFDGNVPTCTRLPLPCAGMVLLEAEYAFDARTAEMRLVFFEDDSPDSDEIRGADVRLRYRVEPDQREAAARCAQAWADDFVRHGAADVKLEPCVRTTARARAPEVSRAVTLPDKLAALWHARDQMPEDPRKERLFQLASELEQGTE